MKKTLFFISLFGFGVVFGQFKLIESPKRLGGEVNTKAEESFPVFIKSDGALYFTRMFDSTSRFGEFDQNIWRAEKKDGHDYSKGDEFKRLNNKFNNCIIGINKDETKVFMLNSYEGKKDLKKGISYSIKKGNNWSKPKEIKIPNLDIEGNFYGFHMNQSENLIVISYLGPNSKGEEDLYFSELIDGAWTSPKSMGDSINSSGFEISPFLSEKSDTLYFSSNGFGGMGDADIFYSIRLGDSWTDWSAPVNIGNDINSEKFDAYFTFYNNEFYWSSNRDAMRSDIYYSKFMEIPPLFATAIGTDVTVYQGSDGKIDMTPEGGIGPYSYLWSNGSTVQDPDSLVKGEYSCIITDSIGQVAEVTVIINEPEPLVINEKIVDTITEQLEGAIIYFDLNSSYHNQENKMDLDKFYEKVKGKNDLKFEVISHCDRRESDAYNIWLSKKRMNRTIDYLVSKGISKDRITGNYKGEREPDIKCEECSEEQFTKNRRTTISIVK